jgi:hypothetical protein
MKNFEQFNENTTAGQVSTFDKENRSKVIKIEQFNYESEKILSKQIKNGLTPFYLNANYEFEEILIGTSGHPYIETDVPKRNRYGRPIENKRKVSLKHKANPWGNIYLITDEDLVDMKPIMDQIRETLKLVEEKKTLLIDLIGSKLTHK